MAGDESGDDDDIHLQLVEIQLNLENRERERAMARKRGDALDVLQAFEAELKRLRRERDLLLDNPFYDDYAYRPLLEERRQQLHEALQTAALQKVTEAEWVPDEPVGTTLLFDDDASNSDGEPGGLFGFMDETNEAASFPVPTRNKPDITLFDLSDDRAWSGQEPRRILEEYCRKRDRQTNVAFRPLPDWRGPGHRVSVRLAWSTAPAEEYTMPVACTTRASAEHYIAVSCRY